MRLTKTQIFLHIRVVRLKSLLYAFLAIQNAPSEDSDQTARKLGIFAGCPCPKVRFLTLRLKQANTEYQKASLSMKVPHGLFENLSYLATEKSYALNLAQIVLSIYYKSDLINPAQETTPLLRPSLGLTCST